MDERCYYSCCAITETNTFFFLWYSDDTDGIVLSGSEIRTFATLDELTDYCDLNGLERSGESTAVYDFNLIDAWITSPHDLPIDSNLLLNAWNLIDDFYKSIGTLGAITDETCDLHSKLSLTNFAIELPGVFTDDNYSPDWTVSVRDRLARVLYETTTRFKNALPQTN